MQHLVDTWDIEHMTGLSGEAVSSLLATASLSAPIRGVSVMSASMVCDHCYVALENSHPMPASDPPPSATSDSHALLFSHT
jgi:hypothetical protein